MWVFLLVYVEYTTCSYANVVGKHFMVLFNIKAVSVKTVLGFLLRELSYLCYLKVLHSLKG